MIVGGIGTGAKSAFAAAFTENLVVQNVSVTEVGGTGVSVAFSKNVSVSDSLCAQIGGNGFEFSRVEGALLHNSRVTGYGLVMMGAAGVELDQSPAVVSHNEFSGGVQNGGINLDCHDGCQPTTLLKNHLFNLGTSVRPPFYCRSVCFLPFLAVALRSQRTVAFRIGTGCRTVARYTSTTAQVTSRFWTTRCMISEHRVSMEAASTLTTRPRMSYAKEICGTI